MTDKTKELQALEEIQHLINDLPDDRRADVMVCAEEIRDLLSENAGDALLAITLIACEIAAVNAEIEKGAQEDATVVAG